MKKFKSFRETSNLTEAFENIKANDFAILTVPEDIKEFEKVLKESKVKFYRVGSVQTYITKTDIQLKESYVIIDNYSAITAVSFKEQMTNLASQFNQDKIRLQEGKRNYLISTSDNLNSYPGYGTLGVQVELSFDTFNENGTLNELQNSLDSLDTVFPTTAVKF